ncbi:Vomp family autotransporter [Bartonella sp. 114]|uniref:Vomp family autotransporter n=1 Tax=Bartonella sp. 114 TaxID=1933909 RepID=UPI00099A94E1|nr:Vomp family autotransporter [Bartonella sp. 114]AQX24198.1 Coiled stalk of trimeric autotransporter adhesin [Bartonella sp. 114]
MKKKSTQNIIKTVSLGAAVSALLSSTSPVFSANVAITGATIYSSNDPASAYIAYIKGSHGSIVLNGDNDYCGVDNVAGRGGAQKPGTAITAEEQYERFINNETFSGRNPYGSSTKKVNWTGGGNSVAVTSYGIAGYDPRVNGSSAINDFVWKSTKGVVSVGNPQNGVTRQIVGVAADTDLSDAVNVAQLQALREMILTGGDSLIQQDGQTGLITIGRSVNGDTIDIINNEKQSRKISGLGGGEVSEHSTEAVNGSQLWETNGKISELETEIDNIETNITQIQANVTKVAQNTSAYFGGGADILNDKAPTYTVNGSKYNDVGSAFEGVDNSFTEINNKISDITENSLVQQDAAQDNLIIIGAETGGIEIHVNNNAGKRRRIVGVLGGAITKGSSEAVNGGQLWDTEQDIEELDYNTSKYFGDGADVLVGKAPTYTISGSEYNDVGSAFKGVDTTFTEINNKISNITENSLVQQDSAQDDLITIGAKTGGTLIDITNSEDEYRKITGVDDGDVTEQSTDAINGGQFWRIASNISEYFGGGADVLGGKRPDYEIDGITYNDVGSAFEGVDVAFTEINNEISNITENSLVQQDSAQDDLITIGAKTNGTVIDIKNSTGDLRKITGVDDGDVTEQSVDAINGGQLWQVASNTSKYFGGGADILNDKAPTYTVNGSKYNDVGSAFEGVDNSFTEINNKISDITENSLVQQDSAQDDLITIGAKTGGTLIDITNSEDEYRKITGVDDGDVTEQSTDAINGGQFWRIASNISEYFGGGADVLGGKRPDYEIDGITYNDVGSAFEGVDVAFTEINNEISNITENSLVQQDSAQDDLITIGAKTNGTVIDIKNSTGDLRKITGVDDGDVTEQSVDAINGGQLWQVASNTSKYFGGGADILNDKAPTYTVNGSKYNDVGSAFEGVDNSFTEINNKISDITENSLVQQDVAQDNLITIGAETGGIEIHVNNNAGKRRRIVGVLGGAITKGSSEAVNGGQLWDTEQDIEELDYNTSKYFGGGADVLVGNAPTYTISGSEYNDVGSAFKGVDTTFTEINNKISNITENSLVQQDSAQGGLITIGKNVNGTEISILNNKKKQRKITGVADGLVFEKSTDAVNGGQLWKTNQDIEKLNHSVEKAETDITNIQGDLSKVAVYTSKYFGGGADVLSGKAPTYTINGSKYNDVGSAFKGVDGSMKDIRNEITNITTNSLVQQDIDTKLITIGARRGGTKIDISDRPGKDRTLSGVKAAVQGNEAVNKDQLDKSLREINKDFETMSAAAVLYDKRPNGSIDYKNITLGGQKSKGPVAIHNLKDGVISNESSDAVNGKQINKLSGDIANIFGGGTEFSNGAFTRPVYDLSHVTTEGIVTRKIYNDVGSAFAGLDANIKNVNTRVQYVIDDFNDKIANISSDALLWSEKEGAFVALHGSKGQAKQNSKLTFLLDGEIDINSTDAITGKQLFQMSNKLASYFGGGAKYRDGEWTDPTFTIYKFGANGSTSAVYKDVASAFAGMNGGMSILNDRIKKLEKQGGQGGPGSDALQWNEEKGAYDANREGKDSKITGVANGKVEKDSKEAVNGGQLWDTNERVTNVENKVDHMSNTINGIAENTVQYDKDANGKKTNKITLAGGDAGQPVVIDNVADGKIEAGSKEAVNGGQLHDYTKQQMEITLDDAKKYTDEKVKNIVVDAIDDAVEKAKDYTDMKFDALNYNIEGVRKEARQAAAIGLAVANLRYNNIPGALSVAFGTGLWRSQSALAFGAGYTSVNGNIRSNVSVTGAGGHWGVGAGVSFTLPVR